MVKITSDIAYTYENGINDTTYNSYNKGKYGFGYKISDYVVITNIFLKRNYNKKVQIECMECGEKRIIWTSSIYHRDWLLCGHEHMYRTRKGPRYTNDENNHQEW